MRVRLKVRFSVRFRVRFRIRFRVRVRSRIRERVKVMFRFDSRFINMVRKFEGFNFAFNIFGLKISGFDTLHSFYESIFELT